MTTDRSSSRSDDGGVGACERAREALGRFVGKSLAPDEDREFRAHLTECTECRDLYRSTIASAARLGRTLREEREENTRVRRHHELHETAIAATGDARRPRRFGLRLALLPAGIALLILLWRAGGGETTLVVHWDGGEVRAAGQLLGAERPTLLLEPGSWCVTRGNARARIASPEAEIRVGLDTQLVVEDVPQCRLRLQKGELELEGAWVVSTAHGVLEIEEGAARLEVRGTRCVLACTEGSLRWTGVSGTRRFEAGSGFTSDLSLTNAR
jgi:hypothetical protein